MMPQLPVNGHTMHYEVHGTGEPVFCSGGWGTFCHGNAGHLPAGLTDRYSVIVFDHRGIGQSDDDPAVPATTRLYAEDVIGLAAALGIARAHFAGIIGIGACIFQQVALAAPGLVRSLVNTGCWARPDTRFRDQLGFWLDVHDRMGFAAFQRMVVMEGFDAGFYARYKERLLGPGGAWSDLDGHITTHRRLTEAALSHDTLDGLSAISAPALVMHNGRDAITPPRLTLPVEQGIPGASGHWLPEAAHVATGREERESFSSAILAFLAAH